MEMDANKQIKVLLAMRGLDIAKLAKLLSEKTGKDYTTQSLARLLRTDVIKYDEMLAIAEVLNFKIEFKEK